MPDFGIMRGFNEKLFGDKLVAGQLPTQLGLIGSTDFGTDPDALAFFARVTAAGGSLSASEQLAIDTLVVQMKADGTWTPMKAIYPMVGASAAACAQNLKSSSFTGTFTSGWTFSSNGVTPNGTSAYMDTNFMESGNLTLNSGHISIYSRTNTTGGTKVEIGVLNSTPAAYSTILEFGGSTGFAMQSTVVTSTVVNTNSLGLFLTTRQNSTQINTFIRNSKTTQSSVVGNLAPINTYLGARNTNGTATTFSSKQYAFASIGDGLTDTQASDFYTAVQAFQTTLSRQV
jgi:hypothetical protein